MPSAVTTSAVSVIVLLAIAAFVGVQHRPTQPEEPDMLGGFSEVSSSSNDEGVEQARAAVAMKLTEQHGQPVSVEVLEAHSQVVAGINYRMKVKAEIQSLETKFYEAQVWAKLAAHGGTFEVTKLEEIGAEQAGVSSSQEEPADMDVQDAAGYAVQQLSAMSNSLFPFQLKEVVSAHSTPGAGGESSEGVTHHLRLRLAQGSQPDQIFDVEVGMDANGHRLQNSKQVTGG